MASKQNIAQYPNGFSDGVTIRGLPVLNTYSGQIWWVDASGAQIGDGKFNRPFATIDTAINHASAGDTILVKAGHTETITAAAGIDADVAGISIIGLGQGRRRPTISFTTADTADIDIDAANITIQNMVFDLDGVASLAAPIDVNAADFTLQGCEFLQSDATNQCLRVVVGATAADRMKIIGNTFRSTTAGAVSAINLVGTADGTEIRGNDISGDYSTAAIENATGNVLTNLIIDDNYIRNDNAGDWAIELVSACTGVISNNRVATDAIATAVDWGSCAAFGNTYFDTSDTDKNGTEIPVAVTVGGVSLGDIATSAATGAVTTTDNAMAYIKQLVTQNGIEADTDPISEVLSGAGGITTWKSAAAPATGVGISEVLRDVWDALRNGTGGAEPGTNKSVVDAIGFDGAAAVTASAGMLRTMAGTTFVVKKALTSSAILQTGVDVTAVSTVGDIEIVDVVVNADGTGLAAGTSFTLNSNNTKGGTTAFFSTAVSGLGANGTISTSSASVTKGNHVLESGKKIVAKCTVADCTGGGTVDVYLVCRRLADNATLTAA